MLTPTEVHTACPVIHEKEPSLGSILGHALRVPTMIQMNHENKTTRHCVIKNVTVKNWSFWANESWRT